MQSQSRIGAGGRRLLLLGVFLATALVAPSATAYVAGTGQKVAAAELQLPLVMPVPDGDYRARPRVFPLNIAARPIAFRDVSARYRNAPAITTATGILVDTDTGEILWGRHAHLRRAPASTSKLMSALVALENFPPDQVITVTPEAAGSEPVETRMELLPGERLTARELLTGMLMISANDAARAFAYGSVGMDDYVAAMNRQALALGLRDSHFTNPVGYPDDPDMYSSAYDLAAVAATAGRDFPAFGQLTATRDIDLPAGPTHRDYRMHNINRLLQIYPAAAGTKSGFTDDAGPCLVSAAVRGNHHLLAVLMNAPRMFDQSRALLEWGFAQEGLPALSPAPTSVPWVPAISH